MRPERAFIADRMAAQHCEALLRGGPAIHDPGPALARALPHLEAELARGLAALTGGEAPRVRCDAPEQATHADFAATLPALAGICAMGAGAQVAPLLIVFDAGAVFGHVDRAFGGQGLCPDPLP